MNLKLDTQIKNLSELDLNIVQTIHLFGNANKDAYLRISVNGGIAIIIKWGTFENKQEICYELSEKEEAQTFYDNLYVVPLEIIKDTKKFYEFIIYCEVGISYRTPGWGYESFQIDKHNDEYNWAIYNKIHGIYPMKDSHYIKMFKTELGAKKALINWLKK